MITSVQMFQLYDEVCKNYTPIIIQFSVLILCKISTSTNSDCAKLASYNLKVLC